MALSPTAILVQADGVASSKLGEELVVLDAQGRMLRGLNATGRRVFELIDGKRSLEEIAEVVARESRVEQGRVSSDVVAFASALMDRQLVRAVGGGR